VVLARPCTRQAGGNAKGIAAGDGGKSWFTEEITYKP